LARNGGQWKPLPRRFGAKSTVHDRFQEWVHDGCLEAAWAALLAVYDGEVELDWQWQAVDGCIVKAPLGKKGVRRGGSDGGKPYRPGEMRQQAAPADGR